jgi:hypothetical protein
MHNTQLLTTAAFVCLMLLQPVLLQTVSQEGYFVFEQPDPKSKSPNLVETGTIYRIIWHVEPATAKNPSNITLSCRRGLWPDVGPWVAIASDIENLGYYGKHNY